MKTKTSNTSKKRGNNLLRLGLIVGVIGGVIVERSLSEKKRHMPHLDLWRRELAKTRGEVQATVLAARIQERYDELYAHRPRFAGQALRWHLESNILPGLALYQILRETVGKGAALAEVEKLFAAWVESRRYPLWALEYVPGSFSIFRRLVNLQMKLNYPPEGWAIQYKANDDQKVAFDIQGCFYLDALTAYGAPELTARFCAGDDVMFARLPPSLTWQRTTTLGRGGERCDFCWQHVVKRTTESDLQHLTLGL